MKLKWKKQLKFKSFKNVKKSFKNVKIRTKLTMSFTIVALLIVFVGLIGISNMQKLNKNTEHIYNENLKGISMIKEVKINLQVIEANVLSLIYEKDVTKINGIQDRISALISKNDKLLKDYKNTMSTKEEEQLYKQLDSSLKNYRYSENMTMKLANIGQYDGALVEYQKIAEERENMFLILDKLVQLNETKADRAYANSESIFKSSFSIVIVVVIGGLFLAVLLGYLISAWMGKNLNNVVKFAQAFGDGDLTQNMNITAKDEIGFMSLALNKSIDNIKNLITEVNAGTEDISSSSEELSATIEEITSNIEGVNNSAAELSKGAEELSAVTEEVSASMQEINATTEELAQKAHEGSASAKEIRERADMVKKKSISSAEAIRAISRDKTVKVSKAIEDGKVVEKIADMAKSIGSIASQTNLLALNAAIEAARVGEHGKGFAVVADEVRKLAEESAKVVSNIQSVVDQVKIAFGNLSEGASETIDFIENNINPDYDMFIETAKQYENDAELMNSMSYEIAAASTQIAEIIEQVNTSIQNVSATAEESVASSQEIGSSVNGVSMSLEDVARAAQNQAELAERLDGMIKKFRI